MIGLTVGIVLFVSAALIANILQSIFRYSYTACPVLFVGLFGVFLYGALWTVGYVPPFILLVGVIAVAISYIVMIQYLVLYWKPMKKLFGSDTVPVVYSGIIAPQLTGQVVKVGEVVLQDVAAWLIVGGLFMLVDSIPTVTSIFTIIVFLLHIPGVWVFGKVYGVYFLVMSTALAFLVPLLYQVDTFGFLYFYALHLAGYVFMYMLMGLIGCLIQSKK